MQRFLKQLFQDILRGENIDLIATIALVLVISILNGLGIASTGLVASITLATLGLIAISLLATRYKIDSAYRATDFPNTVHLINQKPASLVTELTNTKEIWMLGLVLRGTTIDNFYSFKRKAGEGLRIRALIVDPNRADMDKIAKRFSWEATPAHLRAEFELTINRYKQISQSANTAENIQLRLIDLMPTFSLYIFPKEECGGIIYVETYGYKSSGSIPMYRITERDNPEWYKHFLNQFELMWQDAEAVVL